MRATDRPVVRLACLLDGSRMSREVHVRFCERPAVQSRRPTHPGERNSDESEKLFRKVQLAGIGRGAGSDSSATS
jgi:hypothetical protein